jgi:hypothetical protein
MKKLITLLTLALSFSFADAMSLKIQIEMDESENGKCRILILNTNTKLLHWGVKFDVSNGYLIKSEANNKSSAKLNSYLENELGLKLQFNSKFLSDSRYQAQTMNELIHFNLIKNDYMITDTSEKTKGYLNIWTTFAYKPSK